MPLTFRIRQRDKLINISSISPKVGKELSFSEWVKTSTTLKIIDKLSKFMNLTSHQIYSVKKGGTTETNGSWVHYLLGIIYIEQLPIKFKNEIKPLFKTFIESLSYKYQHIKTFKEHILTKNSTVEELKEEIKKEIKDEIYIQDTIIAPNTENSKNENREKETRENNNILTLEQIFQYDGKDIRIVNIINNIWFIAADIAEILGYSSAKNMIRILHESERGVHNMSTPSGMQQMTIINESGLYHAIFKSNKPLAEEFRLKVTNEILPNIRKKGYYLAPTAKLDTLQIDAKAIEELQQKHTLLLKEKEDLTLKEIKSDNEFFLNQKGYIERLISEFELNSKYGRKTFEELKCLDKNLFYMAFVGCYIDPISKKMSVWIKYGWTGNGQKRESHHVNENFEIFELFYVIECDRSNQLEKAFKKRINKLRILREKAFKLKNQIEVFILTKDHDMESILSITDQLSNKYRNNNLDLQILELKKKLLEKENEIKMLQKEKEKEIELLKKDTENEILKIKLEYALKGIK